LGKEKLAKELDVIKLIQNIRDTRLMKQGFLSQGQQMLFKFQKQQFLDSDNSETPEDNF
jgi:hypothetical protein